ncbi:hypothetical protein ACFFIF_10885 [Vagococcus entomophilus]|uniref:LXG domain-containing protein n=1 Tax=Vagococcus entomophilus TaxID=1160095 RepID=A0A430AF01_9ENTE|nr:hypothetical protein [Vagococcus entomophilus]RSU06192.1 hypothetical protein CBF30_10775 [Vagococcus entomophilus]
MVKMNLGEVRTQTQQIKSYCQSLREGAENLNTVASAFGLEVGISGTTGDSIKSYLSSMYPTLAKAMVMHADSVEEANQAYVDGYVSMCGGKSLDSDELQKQIDQKNNMIKSLESSKMSQETWYRGIDIAMQQAIRYDYQEGINSLNDSISTNEKEQDIIQKKLDKLIAFNGKSPSYFAGTEESKNLMNEGLQLLGGDPSTGKIGAGSWNGHGFNKVESNWQNRVNDEWAKVDPEAREQAALDKGMSELQLPKAAQVYYEKIMREALKNTPINQWNKAINSLNELLIFDDKGNLLRVEPINLGAGDGVIVSKNGVYDAKLTAQANKEYDSKRLEQLKEVLPQLVAGVTEVLLGLGINGLDLAGTYFSGGTLALVGASQGAAAIGTTTTVIGAGTVTDAIRKMGVTSGSVSYSFANNYGNRQDALYPNGKYVSSPKHTPEGKGGWGSEMDLGSDEAQKVLNESKQVGNQKYGLKNGQIYEFQPDGAGGWHGYKIKGTELTDKKGGADVLRNWLKEGKISNSQYNKLRRGK